MTSEEMEWRAVDCFNAATRDYDRATRRLYPIPFLLLPSTVLFFTGAAIDARPVKMTLAVVGALIAVVVLPTVCRRFPSTY